MGCFILFGLLSLLGAHLEFIPLYGIDLSSHDPIARNSLLNQIRFLRVMELGFGLVCFSMYQECFSDKNLSKIVIPLMFIIPLSRVVSFLVDGPPNLTFTILIFVETALAICFWFGARQVQTGT